MFSYTQPREAILDYERWFLRKDENWHAASVVAGKHHGKTVIVQFAGVVDRDEAARYVGCDIATDRKALPEPARGSYYWTDLEGLQVINSDGTELGRVAYLMETGANDVLVVEGEKERLIPFIAERVILDVDLAAGVIRVAWDWD